MRADGLLGIGISRTGGREFPYQFAVAQCGKQNRQQSKGVRRRDVTIGQAGDDAKGIEDGHWLQVSQAHHHYRN
ncbi:hypothetical protein D3C72_1748100 [compost metagenome]